MDQQRFDAIIQSLAATPSRRQVLRLLAAAIGGLSPPTAPEAAAGAPFSTCRAGGARCKKGHQCCSGTCKKKRRKRRGKCTSLGPFAANCPPTDICLQEDPVPFRCIVAGNVGSCTAGPAGAPFCSDMSTCNTSGSPICADDADCAASPLGPLARCIPCAGDFCVGDVMCAIYVGDA